MSAWIARAQTDTMIDQLTTMLRAADTALDQSHAYQSKGHLYGNLHTALSDLLSYRYGANNGANILSSMVECGEGAGYVVGQFRNNDHATALEAVGTVHTYTFTFWTGNTQTVMAQSARDAALTAYDADYLDSYVVADDCLEYPDMFVVLSTNYEMVCTVTRTYCDCPNNYQWSLPNYSDGDQEWFCFACDLPTNVFTPTR